MQPLVSLVNEADALESPTFYFPPEWRNVQPVDPPTRDPADQAHPLLAALGVGMAMLAPLLEPLPVTCRAVLPTDPLGNAAEPMVGLTSAFSSATTLRLSEACLCARTWD